MFALFLLDIRLFLSMLSELLALSVSSLCFSLPLRLLRLNRQSTLLEPLYHGHDFRPSPHQIAHSTSRPTLRYSYPNVTLEESQQMWHRGHSRSVKNRLLSVVRAPMRSSSACRYRSSLLRSSCMLSWVV